MASNAQPASSAPVEREPPEASHAFEPNATHAERSCEGERPLVAPSGGPPRLTCREARAILDELSSRFAGSLTTPRGRAFGNLVVGWLDPHGLWSAAPDSPLGPALRSHADALMAEMHRPASATEPCLTAAMLGSELSHWVSELGRTYDSSLSRARSSSKARAASLARGAAFQDDPVTEPARLLASRLGDGVARFARAFPTQGAAAAKAARARYFPELSAEAWSEVVLAAALRAYVPLVDPHGDWAPFEEEWSLYADDPGMDADPRLWRQITRTAVGVRIVDGPREPLALGDLVLSVDGIATAGMPLEQAEQLARLEPATGSKRRVEVLRRGRSEVEGLEVDFGAAEEPTDHGVELESEQVRFGDGHVLVVRIPDIADGLGEALGRLLFEARSDKLSGVLLDLRGNGGGSTDAAAALIGLFLPGVALFPLSSHGQLVEVMRAREPAVEARFQGPVAALVDGYTASAAEMIAGAFLSYKRGPLLGSRTFGKGCIQEYVDDHEGKGVMRVTTLVFALPDGSPIQRTGLVPELAVASDPGREREADLAQSLPSYSGPDVRDRPFAESPPWPSHRGHVGPCSDRGVCRALLRLGVPPVAQRSPSARRPRALSAGIGRP
jgi:carboxyl-terminal processing protease